MFPAKILDVSTAVQVEDIFLDRPCAQIKMRSPQTMQKVQEDLWKNQQQYNYVENRLLRQSKDSWFGLGPELDADRYLRSPFRDEAEAAFQEVSKLRDSYVRFIGALVDRWNNHGDCSRLPKGVPLPPMRLPVRDTISKATSPHQFDHRTEMRKALNLEEEWDVENGPVIFGRRCPSSKSDKLTKQEVRYSYRSGKSPHVPWENEESPPCSLHGQMCTMLWVCRELVSSLSTVVRSSEVPECNLPRILRRLGAPGEAFHVFFKNPS
eukprot:GHVN01097068.1.p1 GENE.GHVN01097068.1~~GHVN01097068.1.p1  ORF type:complete len:274 (-),score=12.49 GHVN01097068.1:274-1071(-)